MLHSLVDSAFPIISALLIKKFQNSLQIQKICLPLHSQSRNNDCKVGAIAQLVEQRTENPCVTGSIPVGTTKSQRVTAM